MSMSSCDAGRASPGAPRSIKPPANRSMSAPPPTTEINQDPPMARRAFVVNAAVRDKVRHLAGVGVAQDDIAKIIGCAPKTLRKRCRDDLDRGVGRGQCNGLRLIVRLRQGGQCHGADLLVEDAGA